MSNALFDQMLSRYQIVTEDDLTHATREIMQQITLAGLYRGGFFDQAAFYGGTCLRIFYGLQRFSEDMDFSLLAPDEKFSLENFFEPIRAEFRAIGKEVIINKKEKTIPTNVESAFLKENSAVYQLHFSTKRNIKIKLEVDVQPPSGFATEHKLLLLPFSFMARCYSLPDLYAGKIHAFLFRNWKTRVKGRDWYDFEWYVRNAVVLNFTHLQKRTEQINALCEKKFTRETFQKMLKERITKTNIDAVKNDVRPFLKNPAEMEIWSVGYFLQLADMIKFKP